MFDSGNIIQTTTIVLQPLATITFTHSNLSMKCTSLCYRLHMTVVHALWSQNKPLRVCEATYSKIYWCTHSAAH